MDATIQIGGESFWDRRKVILERLRDHSCTAMEFLDLFPSVDAAGHALTRLYRKGRIKLVGYYNDNLEGGASFRVFSTRRKSPHLIPHEVGLTKWVLRYRVNWLRGSQTNRLIEPDAETVESPKRYIEFDLDTMHISEIKRRFARYEKHKHLFEGNNAAVIWICPNEKRRDELRAEASSVAAFSVFGVGHKFLTVDGKEVSVDMPVDERFDDGGR